MGLRYSQHSQQVLRIKVQQHRLLLASHTAVGGEVKGGGWGRVGGVRIVMVVQTSGQIALANATLTAHANKQSSKSAVIPGK